MEEGRKDESIRREKGRERVEETRAIEEKKRRKEEESNSRETMFCVQDIWVYGPLL